MTIRRPLKSICRSTLKYWRYLTFSNLQSGSIVTVIFASLLVLGGLGVGYQALLKGPVSSMSKESKADIARQSMQAATRLVAVPGASPLDCDVDGMVEPLPYVVAGGGVPYPVGGGLIPSSAGAAKADPWGNALGYCVWDHGGKTLVDNVVACGGTGALRLPGGNVSDAIVVAIISAGPDKAFQASCVNWANASTPLINKPAASDDIVVTATMEELLAGGETKLQYYPDAACIPAAVGLMRIDMGVVQLCTETGWEEVGADVTQSAAFTPTTNATLNTIYTSNQISFSGFHGEKPVTVNNGATILVNGVVKGASTTIKAGDLVSLRATAANTPQVTLTFTFTLQHTDAAWTLRTRDYHPAALSITPTSKTDMHVAGPGSPTAYGATASFIVRNTGEVTTTAMLSSQISNTTNFEFYTGGGYVGDSCNGLALAGNATCVLDVRPKATTGTSPITSTLTARTASLNAVASPLSGNVTNMGCTPPWGGAQIAHGASLTAYQTATVPFGNTCASQTRTCSNGTLSNSYTFQNCTVNPPAQCTPPWGGAPVAHNGTITAYQTPTHNTNCASIDEIRTCNNGTFTGSYTNQTCYLNCQAPWGVWVTHGTGITAYGADHASDCNAIAVTRNCTNGSLNGTYAYGSCNDNCFLDGVWVDHGVSRVFYTMASGICSPWQNRTCNDGTFNGSGTYNQAFCNDTDPDAINFNFVDPADLSTVYTSNMEGITGIGSNVPISVSGGGASFRVCNDAACSTYSRNWGTGATTINNGQFVQLRMTSSASGMVAKLTNLTLGSGGAPWNVTTGSDDGYFVMINAGHNGDYNGIAGANTYCYNELNSRNWMGKANSNVNIASKVRAFLCSSSSCAMAKPSKRYYFAVTGSTSIGGHSFVATSAGKGPGDQVAWTNSTRFGSGRAEAWTGREYTNPGGTLDLWDNNPWADDTCNNWNSASSSYSASYGGMADTNDDRWEQTGGFGFIALKTCNTATLGTICFVDPMD